MCAEVLCELEAVTGRSHGWWLTVGAHPFTFRRDGLPVSHSRRCSGTHAMAGPGLRWLIMLQGIQIRYTNNSNSK